MNTYTSQQVLLIYMQPKHNTSIPEEDDNASENFAPHEDKKSTLEKQDIKRDDINLVGKSSDTESRIRDGLLRRISQDRFIASELLSL